MKLTYETINLLMLLIPGLLSSSIFGLLVRRDPPPVFEKIIESLIFTFLIYISISLFYTWEPLAQAVEYKKIVTYKLSTDKVLILLTVLFSIIIPSLWGAIAHYDLHMRILRKLRLTDSTSRDTAWDDVFIDEKRHLTVHLKDERRIQGWPLYYSNNTDEGFIYLSESSWIDSDNQYIDTESHGILINKSDIDLIEFMFNTKETEEYERKRNKESSTTTT